MVMLEALNFARKHIGWIVGGIGCLILGFMLHHSQGQTRAANDRSAAWEKLFHAEQSAFRETVANVRARTAQAKAADAAHALKVERDQAQVSQEVSHDFQARVADIRRRYALGLQHGQAQVGLSPAGGGGNTPVPSNGPAAGRPDAAAGQEGLSDDDRLICTVQAEQLDSLITWNEKQGNIDRR